MAEIVSYTKERTIPEYELMRKHRVFPDRKIRSIVKARETHQYKLSKTSKVILDYGDYIIYEKKLFSAITAIENSRKEKFSGLTSGMVNRIIRLYKEAIRCYPDEIRLWQAYLKFCKANFISEVPSAYEKLIQKQGHNPSVWSQAALWYHSQGNNKEKVKSLFFRGLQRHPESEIIYTSFFNVLLSETAAQPKEYREASFERVIAIYNTAKKKICHVSLLINMLGQCEDDAYIEWSKPLQKMIINDMMELYPREEAVWDLLAQRELRGCSISDFVGDNKDAPEKMDVEMEENKDNLVTKKRTLKRRIEMCFSIYQTAVETLKTSLMWSMFIDAMMELNNDLSTQQVLKRKKLAIAFRGAHESNCMSEDHYYAYINLLMESRSNKEYIINILNAGTERHASVKLWEQYMTFYIMEDNQPKFYETFRRAVSKVTSNTYCLWKLCLQYYQTRYDDQLTRMQGIYKEACRHPDPQFRAFRPQYLEWTFVNNTLHHARKAYVSLLSLVPPSYEVHLKMIQLENQTLKPNTDRLREYYENAVNDFGKTRCDVWLDYIQFEKNHEPKRMSHLYERATKTLLQKYVDNFITEHCLLTIDNPDEEITHIPTESKISGKTTTISTD